jgi:hypothetical protein
VLSTRGRALEPLEPRTARRAVSAIPRALRGSLPRARGPRVRETRNVRESKTLEFLGGAVRLELRRNRPNLRCYLILLERVRTLDGRE